MTTAAVVLMLLLRTCPGSCATCAPCSEDSVYTEEGSFHTITIRFPAVAREHPEIGEVLRESADSGLDDFRALLAGYAEDPELSSTLFGDLSYEVSFCEEPSPEGLVCILMSGYEYSGGAHGIDWTRAFVFDKAEREFIEPFSLLGDSASAAAFCAGVVAELERRLDGEYAWIEEGAAPDPGNYRTLLPLPDSSGAISGFRVIFDSYQVAPYAFGPQEVVLPVI
jgi:hypothetical protein